MLEFASTLALAATPYALVTGSVFDRQGGPVEGAAVRLLNPSIGFSQNQTTDSLGTFTFPTVPPAEDYFVSVEKTGFSTQIRQGIQVAVAEVKMVLPPFLLQPAAPAVAAPSQAGQQPQTAAGAAKLPQTPERTTEPAVSLDLLSSTLGGVIDSRMVHTLPLRDRDFIDLALLVPGTYPVEQGSVLEGASLVVNGVRANMNNFLLDGADNNDYTINQSLPFQIVEALQEFRVQTSTSTAEYGRSGGAQINSVSRSGSNALHGTLFEFHRNSALGAKNFFSAYNGGTFHQYDRAIETLVTNDAGDLGHPLQIALLASLYDQHKPRAVQNQFGGNLGGALKKDSLFGFINWESFRVSNPHPLFEHVPGNVWRQVASPCVHPGWPRFVDREAPGLLGLFPAPNVGLTRFTNPDEPVVSFPGYGCQPVSDVIQGAYFVGESKNRAASDNSLERIDWRKNEGVTMSFRHNVQRIGQTHGGAVPADHNYPGSGSKVDGHSENLSYNHVQQVGPRLASELRLGWNRFRLDTRALDRLLDPSLLGFKNLNFTDRGLPTVLLGGAELGFSAPYATLGADVSVPSARVNTVWAATESLSQTFARHTMRVGGELRLIRLHVGNAGYGRGLLAFSDLSFATIFHHPTLASIARVSPDFGGGFDRSFRTLSVNGFVQDKWRLRSNLTLDYGLRYELNTAPVESRNRLVNYFPDLGGLVRVTTKDVLDPFGNAVATAPDIVARGGFRTDGNNFAPRFGFAWDPWGTGKTVVRAAYAVMFDQQPLEPSVNMLLNPPFVEQWVTFFPFSDLADSFPAGFPARGAEFGNTFDPNGDGEGSLWFEQPYSVIGRDPNTRTSYVQQFHLDVQHQLATRAVLELAAVSSLGRKLPRLRNLSRCTPTFIYSHPYPCLPHPSDPFSLINVTTQENSAKSHFYSLVARFETRYTRGANLRVHYQWAKSIDDASGLQPQISLFSPAFATIAFPRDEALLIATVNSFAPTLNLRPDLPFITTRPPLPQDSNNLALERGLSDFDVHHRLVIQYVYDLPKWLGHWGLSSGWQMAGVTAVQSGQPYSIFYTFSGIPLRPDLLRRPKLDYRHPERAIEDGDIWYVINFGGGSVSQLKPGRSGRNAYRGPGSVDFDFSAMKNTPLSRRGTTALQFRVDIFNALNRANFREPFSNAGSAWLYSFFDGGVAYFPNVFFGQILQARPPREIQFALKILF